MVVARRSIASVILIAALSATRAAAQQEQQPSLTGEAADSFWTEAIGTWEDSDAALNVGNDVKSAKSNATAVISSPALVSPVAPAQERLLLIANANSPSPGNKQPTAATSVAVVPAPVASASSNESASTEPGLINDFVQRAGIRCVPSRIRRLLIWPLLLLLSA